MDEEQKKEVAVFRFGVISDFVNGKGLDRKEKKRLLKEKCARKWDIPYSQKTRIGETTIRRWIRHYKKGGNIESLMPGDRCDRGKSRAIDEETGLALINLKQTLPALTVPQIIEQVHSRNLATPGLNLTNSSVYRFFHANGLMDPIGASATDRRKFEAEFANDLWQTDVMHGPKVLVDGKQRKSYLVAFLDDHSRLMPYARFYLSETVDSILDALKNAVMARGLPIKLYADNGAAYRSKRFEYIVAALSIALIHSKPYQPQGKGKIERLFRTIRNQVLTGYQLTSLEQLNKSLQTWISRSYHVRKHGSTGETPISRFTGNMHCIRTAPDKLRDYFRTRVVRTVAKDRTVALNGKLYEAAVQLIGKKVNLLYHENQPDHIEVFFDKKSHGLLIPVNLNVNCRVRRDKNGNPQIEADTRGDYRGGCLWTE